MSGKFDWKATLATVAPALATALGGPLAGVAVHTATKALGISADSEDALAAAVASGDPNVLVELKKAEHAFLLEMERMELSLEELKEQRFAKEVEDRGNARDMAKAVGIVPQVVLSAIYTIGYFWMVSELFQGDIHIPEKLESLANGMIAIMTGAQLQIMNFWFGSSAGSKQKTQVMANG
jgi:hypothetical protein